MTNFASYILASSYTAVSPFLNTASAVCKLNGEVITCPSVSGVSSNIFGAMFGFFIVFWIISILLGILILVSNWKIYQKAGKPGWASIIPIYNVVVLLEIVKKPIWWIVLFLVPFVNVVIVFLMVHNLSKVFRKDIGFTLGLIFLPFIFYPILAFGKSSYIDASSVVPPDTSSASNTPATNPSELNATTEQINNNI